MALELGLKLVANTAGFTSQIDNASKVLSQGLSKSLADTQNQLANLNKAEATSENVSKSLKAQFREMREELAKMRLAGLEGTEAYKQLDQQAGKLQDTLQDASQSVKTLSSDTFALDAGVQIVQGLAGAFQTYQGVLALTGNDNEDVQKSLQKLMAVMSVAQGIQQVGIFLTEQSAAKKVIDTTITYAQSVAYRVLGVSIGTASAATRIFASALAATGIGAVLIAIGIAASALMSFRSETDKAKEAWEDLQSSLNYSNTLLDKRLKLYEQEGKIETAKAKARGATEDEIQKIQEKSLKKRISAIKNELDYQQSKGVESVKLKEKLTDLENELALSSEEFKVSVYQKGVEERKKIQTKQLSDQKKINEETKRNEEELRNNLDSLKKDNLSIEIENAKRAIEERKKLGRQFTDEEAAAFRLQQANLYDLEKQRIDDSYEAERAKILKLGPETSNLVQDNLAQLKVQYENAKLKLNVEIGFNTSSLQNGVLKQFGNQKFDNSNFEKQLEQAIQSIAKAKLKADAAIDDFWTGIGAKIEGGLVDIGPLISNAIVSVADTFGSVIAQGGTFAQAMAKSGENILKIVGSIFQDLGKQLIFAGKLKLLIDNVLTKMFGPAGGPAAIAAGFMLVTFGALIKNIKLGMQNVKAFADGGIVTGPTMGLVGEAGKEAIIPLDRIGEVLGSIGGSQNVFVTGQLSGETIYLQQQRVSQRRGRFV